jgi:hypothetical protein
MAQTEAVLSILGRLIFQVQRELWSRGQILPRTHEHHVDAQSLLGEIIDSLRGDLPVGGAASALSELGIPMTDEMVGSLNEQYDADMKEILKRVVAWDDCVTLPE